MNEWILTKRLILRSVTKEDVLDMFEYASDIENTKYVEFKTHNSIKDTKLSIETYFLNDSKNKFAIVLKENNKMIGTIDFRINNNEAELGWIINKKYWSKGYCTEAANELIKIYNRKYNIKHFIVAVNKDNLASKKVIEKLGFIYKESFVKKNTFKIFNYEKYLLNI